ncbi:MAG TPA: hypothetical protein VN158_02170, partial [Caulobacter sp.]|nr:hypothetical protein [Caulobacter sp.]
MAELATPSPERSLDTDAVGLRLGRGLPNLAAFGDKLFVETAARARPQARVLWLNHRWFAEQGLDSLDASTKAQLHEWLIADFAFETAEADSADRTVRADRYGGTGGATHGGSGRCAVVGAFNAKGVGRTPLVPEGVDWTHAHGLLSLDEAVREAISAEIAHAELPYGAVPVIAILDGGGEYWTPEGQSHRRAILVRPNFVRPAYAERSIFFGTSGKLGSDQQIDAERVRDVVRGLTGPRPARLAANLSFDRLEEMFGRFAFQLGYGRAHRLWQGRFLTSNLSIDGALADF